MESNEISDRKLYCNFGSADLTPELPHWGKQINKLNANANIYCN